MQEKDIDSVDKSVVIVYIFQTAAPLWERGRGSGGHKYWYPWVNILTNSRFRRYLGERLSYNVLNFNSKQLILCYKQISKN